MDESQKIILDLLQEVRREQKKDSEKILKTDLCVNHIKSNVSELKKDLSKVKEETIVNTAHMGEHMTRTEVAEKNLELLKNLYKDNQKRIISLENKNKIDEKIKHWFKDNLKYWLTIGVLMVGLITKISGLW